MEKIIDSKCKDVFLYKDENIENIRNIIVKCVLPYHIIENNTIIVNTKIYKT